MRRRGIVRGDIFTQFVDPAELPSYYAAVMPLWPLASRRCARLGG